MIRRFTICIKAWGVGVGVMGLPYLFLYPNLIIGSELWLIPLLLFAILFPALLLFDCISKASLPFSNFRRFVLLLVLSTVTEAGYYMLLFRLNQIEIRLNGAAIALIVFFTLLSTFVVFVIITRKKQLVIVQKEI